MWHFVVMVWNHINSIIFVNTDRYEYDFCAHTVVGDFYGIIHRISCNITNNTIYILVLLSHSFLPSNQRDIEEIIQVKKYVSISRYLPNTVLSSGYFTNANSFRMNEHESN